METQQKTLTVEEIKELMNNFENAKIAVNKIYSLQTQKEKSISFSIGKDGVGFSSYDAKFLNDCVFKMQRNQYMSENEKQYMILKIKKYAKQMQRIIKNEPNLFERK